MNKKPTLPKDIADELEAKLKALRAEAHANLAAAADADDKPAVALIWRNLTKAVLDECVKACARAAVRDVIETFGFGRTHVRARAFADGGVVTLP